MAWIKSFVTKAQKRLAANVERDHNGRLWLTVLTTDPSLQGAIVEFQFITLTPKETPVQSGTLRLDEKVQDDCWQAICSLDLSEQNLERCEAKFEITPLAD
jgi:hypothetical protein